MKPSALNLLVCPEMGPMPETEIKDRIRGHRARLAIIGQGYVGLPLAVAFGHAGFPVTGLDTDPDKITALNAGRWYIPDVESTDLQHLLGTGRYEATSDFPILEQSDVAVTCVPTPIPATSLCSRMEKSEVAS